MARSGKMKAIALVALFVGLAGASEASETSSSAEAEGACQRSGADDPESEDAGGDAASLLAWKKETKTQTACHHRRRRSTTVDPVDPLTSDTLPQELKDKGCSVDAASGHVFCAKCKYVYDALQTNTFTEVVPHEKIKKITALGMSSGADLWWSDDTNHLSLRQGAGALPDDLTWHFVNIGAGPNTTTSESAHFRAEYVKCGGQEQVHGGLYIRNAAKPSDILWFNQKQRDLLRTELRERETQCQLYLRDAIVELTWDSYFKGFSKDNAMNIFSQLLKDGLLVAIAFMPEIALPSEMFAFLSYTGIASLEKTVSEWASKDNIAQAIQSVVPYVAALQKETESHAQDLVNLAITGGDIFINASVKANAALDKKVNGPISNQALITIVAAHQPIPPASDKNPSKCSKSRQKKLLADFVDQMQWIRFIGRYYVADQTAGTTGFGWDKYFGIRQDKKTGGWVYTSWQKLCNLHEGCTGSPGTWRDHGNVSDDWLTLLKEWLYKWEGGAADGYYFTWEAPAKHWGGR